MRVLIVEFSARIENSGIVMEIIKKNNPVIINTKLNIDEITKILNLLSKGEQDEPTSGKSSTKVK